jgi:MoaA/NifB/PqqE/SkfB family radical SAM enzyme
MPFETAKKVIDELSSDNFKSNFGIVSIGYGTLGDDIINPNFINILRYAKQKLPTSPNCFFTNFQNLNKDLADIIIKENLLDNIICNIDGATEESYFQVKRIKLDRSLNNLKYLITKRNELESKISISINAITLNQYIHTIKNNFDFYPLKLTDKKYASFSDDFIEIEKILLPIINEKIDTFRRSGIRGWAEREQTNPSKINYRNYICPYLNDIKNIAYIAPDGTWFACCLDINFELDLGNVNETTLSTLANSKKRKFLIDQLEKRQFKVIKGPCLTVNCCQMIYKNQIQTILVNLSRKYELINSIKNILLNKPMIRNIRRKLMD